MLISQIRAEYHKKVCGQVARIRTDENKASYPNFADSCNRSSVQIATEVLKSLGHPVRRRAIGDQVAGNRFEAITKKFIEEAFETLRHLRPGHWKYSVGKPISSFSLHEHLQYIESPFKEDRALPPALKGDYIVRPDILISRTPVSDEDINSNFELVRAEDEIARLTPFRRHNQGNELLHASISCEWTIRSDCSQNTRIFAWHRRGNLPHIVAVTAEPLPTRLAALALGTGDLDCVYHFALPELKAAVVSLKNHDQLDILQTMIDGHRLRDISDLPFDLAV